MHSKQQSDELNKLLNKTENYWIGLQADTESWMWSLEKQGYYSEGEYGFRSWNIHEPNGGTNFYKVCTAISSNGHWIDDICGAVVEFICYHGNNSHTFCSMRLDC